MPSFRQPPTFHELIVNRKKWAELPPDLQAIVKYAAMAEITRLSAYTVDHDSQAADELVTKHGVQILRTPTRSSARSWMPSTRPSTPEAQKNPFFAKVLAAQKEYARKTVAHAQKIDASDGHRGPPLLAEAVGPRDRKDDGRRPRSRRAAREELKCRASGTRRASRPRQTKPPKTRAEAEQEQRRRSRHAGPVAGRGPVQLQAVARGDPSRYSRS
jgi:hypothetical protein